jgi:predicted carbohydrate-binding protein with CBM5 and CBM33 domain
VWRGFLAGPGSGGFRPRAAPGVWSALEYGCHVRDVLRLYDERLGLMLTADEPHYPNWDQNETAVADRYGEQDPAAVAAELQTAADAIAARFEGVSGDQWQRTGVRSDGARFTVESFARYFIHDPVHHLYDVTGDRAAGET